MRSLFALLLFFGVPIMAAAEQIEQFNTDVTVHEDGSLRIAETITYDFAGVERRGIFREIPLNHPQHSGSWYTDRVIDVTVSEVLRDGTPEPYTLTGTGDAFRVRIGDPDVTISGRHTYTLRYTVDGALTYYDDGAVDLYWNITGNEWTVPLQDVRATVVAPVGVLLAERACYAGPAGSSEPCTETIVSTSSVAFLASELAAGEGLTIAQALDPAMVATQVRTEWNLWWLWLLLGALWLIGLGVFSYRHHQKHNPKHTVVAQYEPYADFKPMFTGVLLDGQLHSRDITAGILYLAEQGFLKIRKTERTILWLFATHDYELDLLRDPQQTETTFQRELLNVLFGSGATVGATLALSALKNDASKQAENKRILQRLKQGIEADLVARGFYEQAYRAILRPATLAAVGLVSGAALVIALDLAEPGLLVGVVILAGLSVIVLVIVSHRRTVKGYEARNHLRGFNEFLSVTGKDRYAFHDAPQKSPQQFTEYLPYAVAFGVEAEWAEVFSDVTIPEPEWYDGGSSGHFAAATLVSDLGSFSQSFSQSSGSSASSGGGSSGGGAGGGGGGSW